MNSAKENISKRKTEHLKFCSSDAVAFKSKTSGFERYDFMHNAATEVDISRLEISTHFFSAKISAPFLISCMTGGTAESDNINLRFASVAKEMNIPLGIGSQRYALNSNKYKKIFSEIRKNAGDVPILSNIGAAQICSEKKIFTFQKIVDDIEAAALVVHLNPLQELLQQNGEPNFVGLKKNLSRLSKKIAVPIIVKEVGSGISQRTANELLECGVKGIDVAGAGGTSWAGVELLRNNSSDFTFWDWGLPASYCIRTIKKVKNDFDFLLIGSGGITNGVEMTKAIALGADIGASARTILHFLLNGGEENVVQKLNAWFDVLKKIMFLTGSKNLKSLQKEKIFPREELI